MSDHCTECDGNGYHTADCPVGPILKSRRPADAMKMKIGTRMYEVTDELQAVVLYERLRDESGEGASTWPFAKLYVGKRQTAEISYNGRVWPVGSLR